MTNPCLNMANSYLSIVVHWAWANRKYHLNETSFYFNEDPIAIRYRNAQGSLKIEQIDLSKTLLKSEDEHLYNKILSEIEVLAKKTNSVFIFIKAVLKDLSKTIPDDPLSRFFIRKGFKTLEEFPDLPKNKTPLRGILYKSTKAETSDTAETPVKESKKRNQPEDDFQQTDSDSPIKSLKTAETPAVPKNIALLFDHCQ